MTTPKLGNGAVTNPKLGNGVVTNAKLANFAVSASKMAAMVRQVVTVDVPPQGGTVNAPSVCPDGAKAISGGFRSTTSAIRVFQNRPSNYSTFGGAELNPTAWRVAFQSEITSAPAPTVDVEVVCLVG